MHYQDASFLQTRLIRQEKNEPQVLFPSDETREQKRA